MGTCCSTDSRPANADAVIGDDFGSDPQTVQASKSRQVHSRAPGQEDVHQNPEIEAQEIEVRLQQSQQEGHSEEKSKKVHGESRGEERRHGERDRRDDRDREDDKYRGEERGREDRYRDNRDDDRYYESRGEERRHGERDRRDDRDREDDRYRGEERGRGERDYRDDRENDRYRGEERDREDRYRDNRDREDDRYRGEERGREDRYRENDRYGESRGEERYRDNRDREDDRYRGEERGRGERDYRDDRENDRYRDEERGREDRYRDNRDREDDRYRGEERGREDRYRDNRDNDRYGESRGEERYRDNRDNDRYYGESRGEERGRGERDRRDDRDRENDRYYGESRGEERYRENDRYKGESRGEERPAPARKQEGQAEEKKAAEGECREVQAPVEEVLRGSEHGVTYYVNARTQAVVRVQVNASEAKGNTQEVEAKIRSENEHLKSISISFSHEETENMDYFITELLKTSTYTSINVLFASLTLFSEQALHTFSEIIANSPLEKLYIMHISHDATDHFFATVMTAVQARKDTLKELSIQSGNCQELSDETIKQVKNAIEWNQVLEYVALYFGNTTKITDNAIIELRSGFNLKSQLKKLELGFMNMPQLTDEALLPFCEIAEGLHNHNLESLDIITPEAGFTEEKYKKFQSVINSYNLKNVNLYWRDEPVAEQAEMQA